MDRHLNSQEYYHNCVKFKKFFLNSLASIVEFKDILAVVENEALCDWITDTIYNDSIFNYLLFFLNCHDYMTGKNNYYQASKYLCLATLIIVSFIIIIKRILNFFI